MLVYFRNLVLPFSATLGLLLCSLPAARALDLATFDVRSQGSGVGEMTGVRVTLLDQMFGPGTSPSYQLFENFSFTPADVGLSFILTSVDDSDFALFEQMITNGIDNGFGYTVDNLPASGGVGHSWNEANLFAAGTHAFGPGSFTSTGQLSGPDYAGYDIAQVILTIDSFSLTSGGGFSSYDFRATAKVVSVPEPGGAAMLVVGAATLGLRRRRTAQTGRLLPS